MKIQKNKNPQFNEKDFIILLLDTILKKGISKINVVELRLLLADYYYNEEYSILFEDISIKKQIEGDIVEIDEGLQFAKFIGILSNPIQGSNERVIFSNSIAELKDYPEEYKIKMNDLVSKLKNFLDKNNTPLKKILYCETINSLKEDYEKKLNDINKQIEAQIDTCDHVRVCTGWDGPFLYRETSYSKCLICGEKEPESRYQVIEAYDYNSEKYSHGELSSYRNERFKELQTIAKIILTKKPNISLEKLAKIMNEFVKSPLTSKYQDLVKESIEEVTKIEDESPKNDLKVKIGIVGGYSFMNEFMRKLKSGELKIETCPQVEIEEELTEKEIIKKLESYQKLLESGIIEDVAKSKNEEQNPVLKFNKKN